MKTLREIQDEVAKDYGFKNADDLISYNDKSFTKNFIYDCLIHVQMKAQHKINKRVEDDYLNDNFDTTSIINDNNLIR